MVRERCEVSCRRSGGEGHPRGKIDEQGARWVGRGEGEAIGGLREGWRWMLEGRKRGASRKEVLTL